MTHLFAKCERREEEKTKTNEQRTRKDALGFPRTPWLSSLAHPWRSLPRELFSLDELLLQVRGPESRPCQRFRWLWAVSPALPSPAKLGDGLHNIAKNRGPPQKMGMTGRVHRLSSHTYEPASARDTPPQGVTVVNSCDHDSCYLQVEETLSSYHVKMCQRSMETWQWTYKERMGFRSLSGIPSSRWCSHLRSG